jgi:hypothetical protein
MAQLAHTRGKKFDWQANAEGVRASLRQAVG